MAYLLFFEISLGPIFWVMIAEIYPLRSRAKAMAAAMMTNWTFNFLISYFFLQMTSSISKAGTFWVYAAFGVAAVVSFTRKLPGTKDKSLEEIERQVQGLAKLSRYVGRSRLPSPTPELRDRWPENVPQGRLAASDRDTVRSIPAQERDIPGNRRIPFAPGGARRGRDHAERSDQHHRDTPGLKLSRPGAWCGCCAGAG